MVRVVPATRSGASAVGYPGTSGCAGRWPSPLPANEARDHHGQLLLPGPASIHRVLYRNAFIS